MMLRLFCLSFTMLSLAPAVESPWARLEAVLAIAGSDPAAARKDLEALLVDQPGFAAAHYNLGCLLSDSDSAVAERHLQAATTSRDPVLAARAWHNLALLLHRQGRLEQALEAAAQALQAQPQDEALRRNHDALRRILLLRRDAARLAAEEAAKKLHLVIEPLPPAWVGEAWQGQAHGAGGAGGPYRFALGSEAKLPAGLRLEEDGRLHGTPEISTVGEHRVQLVIAEGTAEAQVTASGELPLRVLPIPVIDPIALPEAILGLPYEAWLSSHGFLNGRWQASGLPAGLTLAPEGERTRLSGTPTESGSFTVRIILSDAYHQREAETTLLVSPDGFAPVEERLPDATAWQAYEHRTSVRGAGGPFLWSATAAGGLAMDAHGVVSGTPEQAGTLELACTVTSNTGRSRPAPLRVRVNPPPVIQEPQPIQLTVQRLADRPLKAEGGTPPLRWALAPGTESALPPGLSLRPDGRLTGVPQQAGEHRLNLRVTDRWQASTQAEVQVVVKTPDDPKEQDDQQEKDQEEKDGQQDGKDQQQQEQNGKDQEQQGQDGKDQQQQQDGKDQQQDGKDQEQQQGHGVTDSQQAESDKEKGPDMKQLSADRFLEDLPRSDAGIRLFMDLDDAARAAARSYQGDPW